jgi:hypothetical protein
MWNGIYRSLRIRGLIDSNLRLTNDGRAALAQCKFFSPPFTANLTDSAMAWSRESAARYFNRHWRAPYLDERRSHSGKYGERDASRDSSTRPPTANAHHRAARQRADNDRGGDHHHAEHEHRQQ